MSFFTGSAFPLAFGAAFAFALGSGFFFATASFLVSLSCCSVFGTSTDFAALAFAFPLPF